MLQLFDPARREQKSVVKHLQFLHEERRPITVEVERYGLRFASIIAMRRGSIIIPRPGKLRSVLKAGQFLRIYDRTDPSWAIRVEIRQPSLILGNGAGVCVCEPPEGFAPPDQRKAPRYSTLHLKLLSVVINEMGERYRVLDLSETGCKVFVHRGEPEEVFPLGHPYDSASLELGNIKIPLRELVARSHGDHVVGCQFVVVDEEQARTMFTKLLRKLQVQVQQELKTPLFV